MVAVVKTSMWGGLHGSLTLILDNADYTMITKGTVTSTAPVSQPNAVNKKITATPTPLKILTLQEETKKLLREFDLQEAVTNIGVQQIVDNVEEQYIEELNEEYFGYANNTIKGVLCHPQTNWCKVMTRERTDATEAFYQAWVPNKTHIITFGRQLTKQQKKCKAIRVIISDEAKTLHCVGQMYKYKSDYFTKTNLQILRSLRTRTRPGTGHLPTSRHLSPYTRHTATTKRLTADSKARCTSTTYHSLAASSPQKVTSLGTSTSRVARSHSWQHKNTVRRKRLPACSLHPHLHSIPLLSSKLNLWSNANRCLKLWPQTRNSW
jgi:hypothetical protein